MSIRKRVLQSHHMGACAHAFATKDKYTISQTTVGYTRFCKGPDLTLNKAAKTLFLVGNLEMSWQRPSEP